MGLADHSATDFHCWTIFYLYFTANVVIGSILRFKILPITRRAIRATQFSVLFEKTARMESIGLGSVNIELFVIIIYVKSLKQV
jgi:hypothetical protein